MYLAVYHGYYWFSKYNINHYKIRNHIFDRCVFPTRQFFEYEPLMHFATRNKNHSMNIAQLEPVVNQLQRWALSHPLMVLKSAQGLMVWQRLLWCWMMRL